MKLVKGHIKKVATCCIHCGTPEYTCQARLTIMHYDGSVLSYAGEYCFRCFKFPRCDGAWTGDFNTLMSQPYNMLQRSPFYKTGIRFNGNDVEKLDL